MFALDWQTISRWTNRDLGALDIAVVNLSCAAGLPETNAINARDYQRLLDHWATRVSLETQYLWHLFDRQPGSNQYSQAYFRMMILVTVLQRDLGVHYEERSKHLSDYFFFSDPKNLFIHGVLETGGGTCVSLPPTFIAVGRRLGYPLKLVTAWRHIFARWDDPTGEQLNVECTASGLVTHSDVYYRHWPRKMTEDESRRKFALQSLSPRQELGVFIGNRGHFFRQTYQLPQAVQAYAHTVDLFPENDSWKASLIEAMDRWEERLRALMPPRFPPMTITFSPREFQNVPLERERDICHKFVREQLLTDVALQEKWWKRLKRDRTKTPADLPVHIVVRCPQKTGEPGKTIFAKEHPAGYDPKNARRG